MNSESYYERQARLQRMRADEAVQILKLHANSPAMMPEEVRRAMLVAVEEIERLSNALDEEVRRERD